MIKLNIKNKKKFIYIFLISFAATVVFTAFMLLVVFRGIFFNLYTSKGNAKVEAGLYTEAIKDYETARKWKSKKLESFLSLANAYALSGDYESASAIVDEAIEKGMSDKENGAEQLHLMMIKIHSASGNLEKAASYIDGISDQYMKKRIEAARPADLSYTPNQGSYDKTQKMSITVREGETVYYTTDGSVPTKFSNVYVEPINIANGETTVTAVSVDANGLVSPILRASYKITNDYEEVSFSDEKVEKMVRAALSKPNGIIRIKELESVTSLSSDGIDGKIKTLTDFDLMPNLEFVYLAGETNMLSLSQLSGKSKLTTLVLSDCELENSDITVLGGLAALETLDLTGNLLTSVDVLSNLKNLKFVYLAQNSIEDISALGAAENLEYVDASKNRLTSVPDLENVSKLNTLIISTNRVSDISTLHRMTELVYLDISDNQIKTAKTIAQLTKLETLNVSGNDIANFDFLSALKALDYLDVSNTSFVSTKPIKDLNLTVFNANDTGLASLDDISGFGNLISLQIASTNVSDLSPIAKLKNLDYVDISYCDLDDISALSELEQLYTLKAPGIDLSGISFKQKDITIVE